MLTIGDRFPRFDLTAVPGGPQGLTGNFTQVNNDTNPGKWKIVFFWPKDFTFICPTEIVAFGKLAGEFAENNAVAYGISIDSEYVHMNWRLNHNDLKELPIPMLSDIKRELSQSLGVLSREAGVALRATFIVDPQNVIRHVSVNDMSVGRNPDEVLRVLKGLQSDELCPCNWQQGEAFIKAA